MDDALSTGDFWEMDELYVKIINAMCRHINRSKKDGFPAKKDKCANVKTIVDKKGTEARVKNGKWGVRQGVNQRM